MITQQELKEFLNYDPEAGEFRWRVNRQSFRGKAKIGTLAGGVSKHGYRDITLFGRHYRASRLAWLYVHGRWPAHQIDHKNGDRSDDRMSNLREATNAQNQCNRRALAKSGFKGVYKHSQCDRWIAEIKVGGRKHHLGSFKTAQEAIAARQRAAQELHGEFARAA